MDARDILSAYLHNYFLEMSSLSYRAIRRRQDGLFASLAFGVAGLAFTHWYAAFVTGDDEPLESAERWIRSALRAQRSPSAFVGRGEDPSLVPGSAYLYGSAGLYFVQALIADSRGVRRRREEAIQRFVEESRRSLDGPPDLYVGTAGCLSGAALLFRQVGDPRLRPIGEDLALDLTSVVNGEKGSAGALNHSGLAHGTAGIYLSLLLWTAAAETPLSGGISEGLTAFVQDALAEPTRFCPWQKRYASLCNGFPGLALLAVKAYQVLGDPGFLTAARGAVRLALDHPAAGADLCCGRAGAAYACLLLAGLEPDGPWRRHAEELALSALLLDREAWTVVGLYGGEAAIPCLALNLLYGITSGPPGLDFFANRGRSRDPSN